METQANWGAAVRGVSVQFKDFFSQNVDSYVPGWDPVVKTETDDSARANFSGKTGAGVLSRFTEGAAVPTKRRYKLYDTAFVHDQYGGQIEVTRMQLMNRDFDAAFGEFKDLSMAAKILLSKGPAQIFNRAFTAASGVTGGVYVTQYADGTQLASTIHPRADGGSSQSNASSTGITLTEANLETGRIALVTQLQDDGNPITVTGPIHLVVPTQLEKTASIITGSTKRSGTANNDLNFYDGGRFPVLASHWLQSGISGTSVGSNTAWFLVVPSIAKLALVLRTQPSLDESVDKNTKSVLFDVIVDFSVGSKDWHGVWCSLGDGAAYSL